MNEIGGYFELELQKSSQYYKDIIKLNSGRNAFKYIVKAQTPTKVYIPNYICNSVIEPLEELNIKYEFYNIDENFEIIQNIELEKNEKLFYVNYFALKSKYIKKLTDKYSDKLIIDNTQAFFEKPLENIDTIYSPRKFFGVSDGGYLSSNKSLNETLEQDESYNHSIQLLGRVDSSASSFYDDYQKAEQRLINQPIREISKLTQTILSSIDYENVIKKRKENFDYLHQQLGDINLINIENGFDFVPFVYPLMIENENLRQKLIENKIYIARYWNEVLDRKNVKNIEKKFLNQIIPLPIDQRYGLNDMIKIVKVIKNNVCKITKNNSSTDLLEYFTKIDNDYSKVLGTNSSFSEYCDKLSKNAEIYYLTISNIKIGLLAFYANNYDEKKVFISSISVMSHYHGYGFGIKLLNFLEEYLKEIHFNKIELQVEKNNINAINFYKRYGFITILEKQTSIIMSKNIN